MSKWKIFLPLSLSVTLPSNDEIHVLKEEEIAKGLRNTSTDFREANYEEIICKLTS